MRRGLSFRFGFFFSFRSRLALKGPKKGPLKGGVPPAGRGGGGGGGGGGGSAAPKCASCGEDNDQKFCVHCGTIQPNIMTSQGKLKSPRAVSSPKGKGSYDLQSAKLREKFVSLCGQDTEAQTEYFLKQFIMVLGDDWKVLLRLQADYTKMLRDEADNQTALNEVQAMSFLQKNGAERTTIQRREEVRDIDLDNDQRISFIEYLMLQFKVMILTEFYKRHNCAPEEDLSKGGVGVTGVGDKLLDQLFANQGGTLPAELEKAIEEFTKMARERNGKLDDLTKKSKGASVKAMAAANEIKQMEAEDTTEMNRLEITLNAAKKKALKNVDGSAALESKRKAELKADQEKRQLSRNSLKEKAKLWE